MADYNAMSLERLLCAKCLQPADMLHLLPCAHRCCQDCIDTHTINRGEINTQCPTCSRDIRDIGRGGFPTCLMSQFIAEYKDKQREDIKPQESDMDRTGCVLKMKQFYLAKALEAESEIKTLQQQLEALVPVDSKTLTEKKGFKQRILSVIDRTITRRKREMLEYTNLTRVCPILEPSLTDIELANLTEQVCQSLISKDDLPSPALTFASNALKDLMTKSESLKDIQTSLTSLVAGNDDAVPSPNPKSELPTRVIQPQQPTDSQPQTMAGPQQQQQQQPTNIRLQAKTGSQPHQLINIKPQTKAGPKPLTNTNTKPQTEAGAQPQQPTNSKPQTKAGGQPHQPTNIQPQTKAGPQPQKPTNIKPQAKAGAQPQPPTNIQPQSKTEYKPQTNADTKSQTKTDTKPQTNADTKPQTNTDTKPQTHASSQPQPVAEPNHRHTEETAMDSGLRSRFVSPNSSVAHTDSETQAAKGFSVMHHLQRVRSTFTNNSTYYKLHLKVVGTVVICAISAICITRFVALPLIKVVLEHSANDLASELEVTTIDIEKNSLTKLDTTREVTTSPTPVSHTTHYTTKSVSKQQEKSTHLIRHSNDDHLLSQVFCYLVYIIPVMVTITLIMGTCRRRLVMLILAFIATFLLYCLILSFLYNLVLGENMFSRFNFLNATFLFLTYMLGILLIFQLRSCLPPYHHYLE